MVWRRRDSGVSLTRDLAERGETARALLVASHIDAPLDAPRPLLAMRIDKRFDALVLKNPRIFDIHAAAAREVADYRIAVPLNPPSLGVVVGLASAYIDAGRSQLAP